MKNILSLLFLLSSLSGLAQQDTIVKYLDTRGRETNPENAISYFVAFPSGTIWQRYDVFADIQKVQSKGFYTDTSFNTAVGPFTSFYRNGAMKTEGSYHLGKKSGLWISYFETGQVNDSSFYREGHLESQRSLNEKGQLVNLVFRDANENLIGKKFDSRGILMDSGRYENDKKEGEWTFYSETGKQVVHFHQDSALSFTCRDLSGNVLKSCILEQEAEPKDGREGWQSYISSAMKLYLPKEYYNGEMSGTVIVRFIVDTDGNIKDAEVSYSSEPRLNAAALNIIKNAPSWKPAIQYNRKVSSFHAQPLTFLKAR